MSNEHKIIDLNLLSRYHTDIISRINTNLLGKANSVHTHSYNDISGTPTSLPADGGNADTVNGHTVKSDVPINAKFTDTTYSAMSGASDSVSGEEGLVPAPVSGDNSKYLRGDGTWASVTIPVLSSDPSNPQIGQMWIVQ